MTASTGRTLTVVMDAADLASAGTIPADGPVLVYDADAWHRLRARPRTGEVIAAADVLRRPADVEAVAVGLLEAWNREASLEWEGWPLMALAGYRHVRWTRRLASVAVPLRDALHAFRPSRVRVFDRTGGHALDLPPEVRRRPILTGLVADIVRRHQLELLEPDPATDGSSATSGGDATEGLVGTMPHAVTAMEFPVGHVLFVGDGPEQPRHAALGRRIATLRDGRPVLHAVRGAVPSGTLGTPGVLGTVTEDDYAGPRPTVEVPAAAVVRDRLLEAAAGAGPSDPLALLAGAGVRPHLEFLFGEYARSIAGNVRRWSAALDRHRPAVVVAGYPEIALEVAARRGRPAVLLPHGPMMMGKERYHRCMPSTVHLAAVGPRHRRMLIASGIEPARIHVTGVPGTPADGGPIDRHQRHGGRLRILVPTSEAWRPSQTGTLPVTSFAREHATLSRLAAAAWARHWTLELRPHPRYDREPAFYGDAFGSAMDDGTTEIRPPAQRPFREALAECDVVVIPGPPTAAATEAARAGRPVVLLTEAAIVPFRRRWGLEGFIACRDVPALVTLVSRLDADPGSWRAAADRSRRTGERLLAPGGTAASADFVLAAAATRPADAIAPADLAGDPARVGTRTPMISA